jgi:hypothetical protein
MEPKVWYWFTTTRKPPCFMFLAVMLRSFKLTCHTTSLCWMVWLWPAFSNSSLGLPTHSHYMRRSVCLLPDASRPKAESENKRRRVSNPASYLNLGPKSSVLVGGFKWDSSACAGKFRYNITNNGTPTSIYILTNSLISSHTIIWSYTYVKQFGLGNIVL